MSGKFEFRPEPLLERRRRAEAESQRDFAIRQRAVRESTQEIERLVEARRRCASALVTEASSRAARDLRLRDGYLAMLEAAIAQERRARATLEAALTTARTKLIAASRERRVLEKLKERRRAAFEAEEARREELAIDEGNARGHERAARERLTRTRR
ncbi:MAG TPA: flagellar export protein FliJ [Candidatus Nitrosotalea sp.]|nr:flagellar export protein FliJ [Candidatus Nitrosotalea sp.]